jgi:16S rRNA (adenine1518-N6/adenine1519-N6)-dimethyltransferase
VKSDRNISSRDRAGGSGLRLKRSLGQHFLRDENIARKIALAINPQPEDSILEIGPGEGALTRYLVGKARHLVAVELDDRVVEGLRERFGGGVVEVVRGDILETDLEELAGRYRRKIRVAGNIPYNITSPILFHVLDHRSAVRDMTIMIQREVARRLVAGPGSKEYGIPSVFCRLFGDIELLFDVPPQCFIPVPAVTSSVMRMTMLERPRFELADEPFFRAMVRAVFGQRRKTLRNTLRSFLRTAELPPGLPVNPGRRPEELTVAELVELSNTLYARTHDISRRTS